MAEFPRVRVRHFGEAWALCLEVDDGSFCPKGHAALSRSTFVKPPALPEVADSMTCVTSTRWPEKAKSRRPANVLFFCDRPINENRPLAWSGSSQKIF
jgi:hypothetical protein